MFDDPPGCWLHRQASFITAFFPKNAEAGVDYDWFPFPEIDQQGTLFAGEMMVTFRDAPETRDFLTRFMGEEVQCAMGEEPGSSRISPNVNVESTCYPNPILAGASEVLARALAGEAEAGAVTPHEAGLHPRRKIVAVRLPQPGAVLTVNPPGIDAG